MVSHCSAGPSPLPADSCAGVLLASGEPKGCLQGGTDSHLHLLVAQAVGGEAVRRGYQQALYREASD